MRDRVVIGYRSECAFYSSVADRVRVPTPQCFYCEISEDAMDFALLLADQAPAVQGDQLAGCGERKRAWRLPRWPACTRPAGAIRSGWISRASRSAARTKPAPRAWARWRR